MDNPDKFFRESHYNIVRVLLSLSGLWPFDSKATRYAIYCGYLLVAGSGFTFQVMGMLEVRSDIAEVIDFAPFGIHITLIATKAACIACTLPKVKILVMKMKEHWTSPKTEEEATILRAYATYGQKFGYVYTVILFGHSTLYLIESLVGKLTYVESNVETNGTIILETNGTSETLDVPVPVGLPLRVNYMVDVDTYYIPIYIHTVLAEMVYSLLMCAVDVLYLTSVQYYCGLLAALRCIMENAHNLKDGVDDLLEHVTKNGKSYSIVSYSIRRHTEAIQYIEILESLYRLPLLLHMGCDMLMISILGFQALVNIDDPNRFSQNCVYLSETLLNMFFENWQGQKIIDSNEKLYHSIYNMKWYEMSLAAKKLVILIMLRSLRPMQITAGKFIVMSYENFSAVIRMSSSYFMLLRSTQTV
ncbi:odorant receptor 67a-like [Odontomachus brunneus]|uniref:odorant receptor 67a-like n=1 Tax=Odontomachus brunneus TaxID=486640 RepID=UPI0013F24B76|nr:odorant receptor 67a-like [Odontomachus brunneus]